MALADNLAALLEPALLIITGGIIGTLVVAMYLPIFHLGDAMSGWDNAGVLLHASVGRLQVVEDAVFLFLHTNKRGALGQLFQA